MHCIYFSFSEFHSKGSRAYFDVLARYRGSSLFSASFRLILKNIGGVAIKKPDSCSNTLF